MSTTAMIVKENTQVFNPQIMETGATLFPMKLAFGKLSIASQNEVASL